jgi:hypothetical protein
MQYKAFTPVYLAMFYDSPSRAPRLPQDVAINVDALHLAVEHAVELLRIS